MKQFMHLIDVVDWVLDTLNPLRGGGGGSGASTSIVSGPVDSCPSGPDVAFKSWDSAASWSVGSKTTSGCWDPVTGGSSRPNVASGS
jgi:hypothetical protein